MEKKNISQKQFKRISTMIITGLGTLVILLTLAVAALFHQSKENEKQLASIEHQVKGKTSERLWNIEQQMEEQEKRNVSYRSEFFKRGLVPFSSSGTKAQTLARTKDSSIRGMVTRLDKLELRLAKYDKEFGVNTMNPYTDKGAEMQKDEKNEVGKYLEGYYAKGYEPTEKWNTLFDSDSYTKIRDKLFPVLPENTKNEKR